MHLDLKGPAVAEIMVVDDNNEGLTLLSTLLRQKGYRVRPSDSGELAIASVQRKRPDLILLDVRMSGMDGFETCRQLKSNPETQDVPVIFITALDDTNDKVLGFRAGGVDFITKPYQEEEVLSRVSNHLEMHFLRKELELSNKNLFNERELLKTTILSIGDGVICTDSGGRITLMNEVAKNMTGWHLDSAIGKPFSKVFHIINEQTRELAPDPILKVIETGKILGLANHTVLISKNGIERPIADSAAPIRDSEGRATGVVLVFRDVTDEKLHLNEIEFLSFHDQLTGLYNRRFFEEELERLDTGRRFPITLVMGDLNGLKMTNDAFGHFAGDELLRLTTLVLRKCFRKDDIVCRYGGDEFVVILPNSDSDDTEKIIARIQEEILQMKFDKGILSISFGWDTKYSEDQNIYDVLKSAEDFMYKKKLLESPSVRNATIKTIVKTLYEKNSREEAHSNRVSELGAKIGQEMKLPASDINKIRTAGLLHDIGKILIPDDVLEKQERLTNLEWETIKRHPEVGYQILNSSSETSELAEIILQHHERHDGKGYPMGLEGTQIETAAKIIMIADAFDAMTCERPYRRALSVEDSLKEIRENAGTQFDPKISRIFEDMMVRELNQAL